MVNLTNEKKYISKNQGDNKMGIWNPIGGFKPTQDFF